MRARKFKVKIQGLDETVADVDDALRGTWPDRRATPRRVIAFESLDGMRRVLTPGRQLLLRIIRRQEPKSVYELAQITHRDRKSVTEDLAVLEELGLVRFRPSVHEGRARRQPIVPYDSIEFAVDL